MKSDNSWERRCTDGGGECSVRDGVSGDIILGNDSDGDCVVFMILVKLKITMDQKNVKKNL